MPIDRIVKISKGMKEQEIKRAYLIALCDEVEISLDQADEEYKKFKDRMGEIEGV